MMLPFIIITVMGISIIFYILFRLKLVKTNFKINDIQNILKQKKSFTETTIRQFSCKHTNLEQNNHVLLCSDCGKIIQNG